MPPPISPPISLPTKGDLLTEPQLDAAVHEVQKWALSKGMIPIAAIMSRRVAGGRHEVLGFGHNHLAEGTPGIHGETGAVINMGNLPTGYADVVATSSLNPCPFCQRTLACHLGVREVRILDTINYTPDLTSYPPTLKPTCLNHPPTADLFGQWVRNPANTLLWERDIGIYDHPHPAPFNLAADPARTEALARLATLKAAQGLAAGEAPIGALILDHAGEVIAAGHPRIRSANDPSLTAAMSAWRAAGSRDHWKDKTLLLTTGPDHIAYAMFKIFNFGQLAVLSENTFPGQIDQVRALGVPVHILNHTAPDTPLSEWLRTNPLATQRQYLGADHTPA